MSKLLQIENLCIKAGEKVLVDQLNFQLEKGSTLAIVGESGSGKSISSLAIMGLLSRDLHIAGSVCFEGEELLEKSEKEFQQIRGNKISMIFQEPMTALNPSMKCGNQLTEILKLHLKLNAKEAKSQALQLFEKVKLPRVKEIFESYPHQISGGQKQRVMIAIAIACKPTLLIADEPTTALDVTVQADILSLLNQLQKEYGMGLIFISHDLGVVKEVADNVLVMFKGRFMEYNSTEAIFHQAQSNYTKGLLACRPMAQTNFRRLPLVSDFMDNKELEIEHVEASVKLQNSKDKTSQRPLLQITDIRKWFNSTTSMFSSKTDLVKAVDTVSFDIYPGETLGLVGESGCGKTTLGRVLSGLEKADEGEVLYGAKDISKLSKSDWKSLHKEIQIIFQDPFSSLNPRISIGEAIREVLQIHSKASKKELKGQVKDLLIKVGLEEAHYNRYPHEFSGGQRQRIGIARALALKPKFIVCDESVSALDVSVQAQIINLLNDLKDDFGFTYLFISHDLAVVKYISDRIMVMKNGQLIEEGFADEVYNNPQEDYTRKLIDSVM